MRRTPSSLLAAAASIAIAALIMAAPAGAQVLEKYEVLAAADIRPPPLLPTDVPPSLAPLDETLSLSPPPRRRGGYALSIVHYSRTGIDANLFLDAGGFPTLKAAVRNVRKRGFQARSTRVRGQRAYLLTKTSGARWSFLVWVADGLVHSMQTSTPKKVSPAQLRATAEALDPLERSYVGTLFLEDTDFEGNVVTTEHTITGQFDWTARCHPSERGRHGTARVTVLRRQGNDFSFDIAPNQDDESEGWSGTVSGTVAPDAVTVNLRATSSLEGSTCDTGPVTFALDQHAR